MAGHRLAGHRVELEAGLIDALQARERPGLVVAEPVGAQRRVERAHLDGRDPLRGRDRKARAIADDRVAAALVAEADLELVLRTPRYMVEVELLAVANVRVAGQAGAVDVEDLLEGPGEDPRPVVLPPRRADAHPVAQAIAVLDQEAALGRGPDEDVVAESLDPVRAVPDGDEPAALRHAGEHQLIGAVVDRHTDARVASDLRDRHVPADAQGPGAERAAVADGQGRLVAAVRRGQLERHRVAHLAGERLQHRIVAQAAHRAGARGQAHGLRGHRARHGLA
jgi:hypothetical protein